MSGLPTSMIGLCQEGKSSPDALGRSAGVKIFGFVSASCWPLGPWFLFEDRTRLPLVGAALLAAHKIEFVFSCQSRNLSTGVSGAYLPSLSRLTARPGRNLALKKVFCAVPLQAAVRAS